MNNSLFIEKAFTGTTRKTEHGSLVRDDTNNIYSYGYHYPLLFRVNGKVYINTAGYSNSTDKHINHAKNVCRRLGIDAISIHLYPEREGYSSGYSNIGRLLSYNDEELLNDARIAEFMAEGQQMHLTELTDKMHNKKRKDTQVYASMESDFSRLTVALAEVEE